MHPCLESLAGAGFSGHGAVANDTKRKGLSVVEYFQRILVVIPRQADNFKQIRIGQVRLIFLDSYLKPFDGLDFGHSFDFGYIWACPAFGGQRPDGFGYGGCNRQLLISLFHCQPLRAATSGCSEAERLAQRVDDAA